MFIYENAVVIWTKDGKGKVYNNIPKADKYFQECELKKKRPIWVRQIKPKDE